MQRMAEYERSTNETSISVSVNIDGRGDHSIDTSIPFMDHLLTTLSKHSMMDIRIKCVSRDGIRHHLIEDTAIVLARAVDKALGSREGIERFGYAIVPMDDSLAVASIDLVNRFYCIIDLRLSGGIEGVAKEDIEHFLYSFASNLNSCMHINVVYGHNDHHKVESAIKALALALRNATRITKDGVASTKGIL
jgi:imidazoleglycerol-phosphate dehydratase